TGQPITTPESTGSDTPTRRDLLQGAAVVAAGMTLAGEKVWAQGTGQERPARSRLKQSIVHWCFGSRGEKWSLERTCQVAKELGYASVELVSPDQFATLKKFELTCAIVGANIRPGPGFMRGFNNPA